MFDRNALVCTMLRLIGPESETATRPVVTDVRRESQSHRRNGAVPPLRLVKTEPERRQSFVEAVDRPGDESPPAGGT